MAKVQTYGPKEGHLPDVGDVFWYFAEARGTDGNWHSKSVYAKPTPHVEFQEVHREQLARVLEGEMRGQGEGRDEQEG
jgi:hypothetical protein